MERLFNEYEALNSHGTELSQRAADFAENVIGEFGNVPIRDIEAVVCDAVSVTCAEMRLLRAMEKRKSDRGPNPWPCTYPGGCEERGLYPGNRCERHGM